MKNLREIELHQLWHRLVRCGVAVLAVLSVTTHMASAQDRSRDSKGGSIVEVHRYRVFDACFYANVDTAIETKAGIDVTLKIAHKQSSGLCGCRSAALRAHVYAAAGTNGISATSLDGLRLVQTTPMFSNTLERYALTIKKRREGSTQRYRIWLSCAS